MALMIATMLHSIATGNMLKASVKVVAVDINPAVVTKLADRGTFQALGLVTDAELFVRELSSALAALAVLRPAEDTSRRPSSAAVPFARGLGQSCLPALEWDC